MVANPALLSPFRDRRRIDLPTEPRSHHHLASRGWNRSRQLCGSRQILINTGGASAALSDRPDDQRLTATGVAAHEDTVHVSGVVLVPRDIAALVNRNAKLRDDRVLLRSDEAHRQQDKLGRNL